MPTPCLTPQDISRPGGKNHAMVPPHEKQSIASDLTEPERHEAHVVSSAEKTHVDEIRQVTADAIVFNHRPADTYQADKQYANSWSIEYDRSPDPLQRHKNESRHHERSNNTNMHGN